MPLANDVMAVQHGGDHYKKMAIQPFEYGHANAYDPECFSIMKYVSRHHLKNGAEDLWKAHHIVGIRVAMIQRYGHPRLACNLISPKQFCELNMLGSLESEILHSLHDWAMGKLQTHSDAAAVIAYQIEQLIELTYPEAEKD